MNKGQILMVVGLIDLVFGAGAFFILYKMTEVGFMISALVGSILILMGIGLSIAGVIITRRENDDFSKRDGI